MLCDLKQCSHALTLSNDVYNTTLCDLGMTFLEKVKGSCSCRLKNRVLVGGTELKF